MPSTGRPSSKQPRIALRRCPVVDARGTPDRIRPAGACWRICSGRDVVPHDLAEHVLFAHATRDQLGVLRAEVEHQHPLARSLRRGLCGRLSDGCPSPRLLVRCRTVNTDQWNRRRCTEREFRHRGPRGQGMAKVEIIGAAHAGKPPGARRGRTGRGAVGHAVPTGTTETLGAICSANHGLRQLLR